LHIQSAVTSDIQAVYSDSPGTGHACHAAANINVLHADISAAGFNTQGSADIQFIYVDISGIGLGCHAAFDLYLLHGYVTAIHGKLHISADMYAHIVQFSSAGRYQQIQQAGRPDLGVVEVYLAPGP
jgi:hypothetical protein